MACHFLKPKWHRTICAFCSSAVPAVKHVRWPAGCANLCAVHAQKLERSWRKRMRCHIETGPVEVQGNQEVLTR